MTTLTKLSQILELKFATENWKFSEEQMNTIRKAFKETVREWLTKNSKNEKKRLKQSLKKLIIQAYLS